MTEQEPQPAGTDPLLRTERLQLGPWLDRHIAPFAEMNADAEVMRYFPDTLTPDDTRAMVERLRGHFQRFGWCFFAVELRSTQEFVGMVGISNVAYDTPFTPAVEIGWRITRAHQRQGYTMEAATACLDYAFDTLGQNRIVSFTPETNMPSWRVMEKLGMHRDTAGDFDHPLVPTDSPLRRHRLYTLTAGQWHAHRQGASA